MTVLTKDLRVQAIALMQEGKSNAAISRALDLGQIQVEQLRYRERREARDGGLPDPFPAQETHVLHPNSAPRFGYSTALRAKDDAILSCPPTAPHKAWFPPRLWNAPRPATGIDSAKRRDCEAGSTPEGQEPGPRSGVAQ